MNYLKSIVVTIPLVLTLSGVGVAATSVSGTDGSVIGTPGAIDSLLNQYSDLTTGETGSFLGAQVVKSWDGVTAFTSAISPMSSYYTVMGGDRIMGLASGHDVAGINENAEAPSVARITVVHHITDLPVSAATEAMTPTSGSLSSSDSSKTSTGNNSGTGTIIGGDTRPTPIPPACFLFGSGLAFLMPLWRRLRHSVEQ